ncbi:MAG: M23 family metallopeptidase [Oligoflexia bacterium]|nr:M23 family metallopeptidase [Oligoflexia bacterium]
MMEIVRSRRFKPVFVVIFLLGALTARAADSSPSPSVGGTAEGSAALSSTASPDGSIVLVTVSLPQGATGAGISASLEGTQGIPFYPLPEKGGADQSLYQAVVAVPFNHKPGAVNIEVKVAGATGERKFVLPLTIVDGQYRSEVLKVDERKISPRKKDLKRIMAEQDEIKAIYDQVTREKFWSGPFQLPLQSIVTSPFGTKRVYNGEMKSFHQGVDFRASIGKPIHAPAPGLVVLAKNLFFTGNTVLIDHGYGVFTIYGHMSKLRVKKGDRVASGVVLGLAGMTGRANGPHLHWGAVVHNQKINPIDLTKVMQ